MSNQLSETTLSAAIDTIGSELAAANTDLSPSFYAISGSHLYGTANSESDIDVRGFHCAPGVQYLLFEEPDLQLSGKTYLPDERIELDYVSYELKQFGSHIAKSDFTAIELFYNGYSLQNDIPELIEALRSIMQSHGFPKLTTRYLGMAQSLRNRYQKSGEDTGTVKIKTCLYALRGVLAAEYVNRNGTVEPRLPRLVDEHLGGDDFSDARELIQRNSSTNKIDYNSEVVDTVDHLIRNRIEQIPEPDIPSSTRESYRNDVQDWMLDVRDCTDTK